MRFILVRVHNEVDFGIQQWRATCATEEKTVDVFFFARDVKAACRHVLARYPSATFSDQGNAYGCLFRDSHDSCSQ